MRRSNNISSQYRCIALDHLGFGLSDKPSGVSYLPQFHTANFARFVNGLDLNDVTLIVHDWGGPIALSWAVEHPDRVRRTIALNSWFFDISDRLMMRRFSAIVGSKVARWLTRHFNFFTRVVFKGSFGDRSLLTRAVHAQFSRLLRPRLRVSRPGYSHEPSSAKMIGPRGSGRGNRY